MSNNIFLPKNFWSLMGLRQYQIDVLRGLLGDDAFVAPPTRDNIKPLSYYRQRKAWESPFDPKFHQKGGVDVRKAPTTDSLPAKKWVIARAPDEESIAARREQRREILAWLKVQKFKFQICLVEINKVEEEVFLFKKEKAALMFKLAWG